MINGVIVAEIIITFCIVFQLERGVFDTVAFFRLSKRLKGGDKLPALNKTSKKRIYILIPVFREQKIIRETILKLLKIQQSLFDVHVVIVTTIREKQAQQGETTEEIIVESIRRGKLSFFKDHISVVQDPNRAGNMATQLNYALKTLSSEGGENDDIYLVYNADSEISFTTYVALQGILNKYSKSNIFAFQQPCAYVKDMERSAPNFLNALALYQTWYCLGHESRLIQKYEKLKRGKLNLGVLVGHGSGMPIKTHFMNDQYPEDLMTEDHTFAFILSASEVPIFSLPALEVADVPRTLPVFIKQRRVWFWNYIGYLACYRKMRKQRKGLAAVLGLYLRGVGRGAYWFFLTLFIILPLLLCIWLGNYLLMGLSFMSTVLFYVFPQYLVFLSLPKLLKEQGFEKIARNVEEVSFLGLLLPLFLILVTDSVGPWITSIQGLQYFFTNSLPAKYKTED